MKKFFMISGSILSALILGVLLTGSTTNQPGKTASTPAVWADDFATAQVRAKHAHLPILALFTGSDWCPWCMKLEDEILKQQAFLDFAQTNLILFKADFPNQIKLDPRVVEQNTVLQEKYRVEGFPTVLLLDATGSVLAETGYQAGGAQAYVAHLKMLLEKAAIKPENATSPVQTAPPAPTAPAAKDTQK